MTSTTGAARAAHLHPSDLRALARIATDATAGVVDLVESMHMSIAPAALSRHASLPYRALRGATRLVGGGAEMSLAQVTELLGRRDNSPQRASALAIINGLWGDYLHNIDSPLALPMSFRYGDAALAPPRRKLLILVHGLCNDSRTWERNDPDAFAAASGLPAAPGLPAARDYGDALARDLGYSPVYLTYNTGLHISTNGRALAMMIDALLAAWPCPVDEIALLGHSMGGLVARSACFYGEMAGSEWVDRLRSIVCLGSPHHGVPLEQRGNLLNVLLDSTPFLAPFSRLGKRRSAGITDLRYGNLVDEDWLGRDRFANGRDDRCLVAPTPGVRYFAVAATLGRRADSVATRLLGDGLVPLDSALGRHPSPARCNTFDEANTWIAYGMSHQDLLARPEVYERIALWLA